MNLFQMLLRGIITENEMNDFIEKWYTKCKDKTPVWVFLGMTESVYEIYATDQERWDSHLKYLRERHKLL